MLGLYLVALRSYIQKITKIKQSVSNYKKYLFVNITEKSAFCKS